MDDIDIIIKRRNGKWSFEFSVDGASFAIGSAESLMDAAEVTAVIVADKIDLPSSFLAEADDA